MSSQPKLLDQVRDVLRLKHYAYETEKSYIDGIFCLGYLDMKVTSLQSSVSTSLQFVLVPALNVSPDRFAVLEATPKPAGGK